MVDEIDHCIRRYCHGTHPADNILNPRWVCLSAIGECLKTEYGALATAIPSHLVALVEQLKMQK
jgi:hypothetical protein